MTSSKSALCFERDQRETACDLGSQWDCGNLRRLPGYSRRKVHIRAVAVWQSSFLQIEIRNISRGGAGLRIHAPVAAGDVLVVALPDGRQISGRARWSRQGFCGIEFVQPLSDDDELLGDFERSVPVQPGLEAAPVIAFQAKAASRNDANEPRIEPPRGQKSFVPALGRLRKRLRAGVRLWNRRQHETMVERACRKQGFSWLAD